MQGSPGQRDDAPAVSSPRPARGTVDAKSGCALPRATSLVEYYMSTTPHSKRRDRQSPNLGSPANYSGIYSVWKSPTKQWSENKGPERLESTSTDSSGPRSADREGDRSRLKHIFAAVQFPSQTGKVVQKDSPRMATANDALESERQRLPGSSHEEGESHGMENAARGGEGARAALEVPVWNATRQQEPHSDLRHEALQEAVQRQQRLYDEQMSRDSAVSDFEPSPSESTRPVSTLSSGRGSGGYTRAPTDMQLAYSQRSEQSVRDPEIQSQYRAHHEASPSPLEISQVPRALNQELAGTQETMAGDADSLVEVAALGLVICNKTISVISPVNGASPGARSPGGTIYGMRRAVTVGLVQVHGILPNSSASRCDGLGVGDEILAVNSLSCRGRSCREVVSYLTPISTNLAGQVQYIKPVHIISRRCSGMRGLRPRETLCHSSIVAGGEQFSRHPNSSPDWLPAMRPNQRTSMNDLPNTGLSASMGAVEEALFQKMRDKPTARSLVPGERKSLYDTTWRTFPLISLSADTWSPADVRMFLEWVFWRQGAGFSISTSEYHRVPAGVELLAMTDENFGLMGFTHDETLVIRCVLGVLRVAAEETAADGYA